MEDLKKKLEQAKLITADDLLRVKGEISMIEKKLENRRGMESEIVGRLLQIEETLKFLKNPNNARDSKK